MEKAERPDQQCLPRSSLNKPVRCTKDGGICSLRVYRKTEETNEVSVAPGLLGSLRTTCPYRFQQNGLIFRWIGEKILGHT